MAPAGRSTNATAQAEPKSAAETPKPRFRRSTRTPHVVVHTTDASVGQKGALQFLVQLRREFRTFPFVLSLSVAPVLAAATGHTSEPGSRNYREYRISHTSLRFLPPESQHERRVE